MGEPGVGFEYPVQKVSWNKRDLLLFANSIGCTADELHFLYELHPNFQAFPTYPTILLFKDTTQDVIDYYASEDSTQIPGIPKLDYSRVVDGQKKIEFIRPLPISSEGKTFEIRKTITGVYDKGKPGTVVESEIALVDGEGTIYSKITGSGFFIGQGGWGGPKGPPTVNYPPPKGRPADVSFSYQTNKESSLLYRLNGDYNPLHATPEPGKKMGFGGTIMHGLHSWNSTARGLMKAMCGSDPANIKEFQARFASPVIPGSKLITDVWCTGQTDKDGWEEIVFVTKIEGGKVCLSNGRALIKQVKRPNKL